MQGHRDREGHDRILSSWERIERRWTRQWMIPSKAKSGDKQIRQRLRELRSIEWAMYRYEKLPIVTETVNITTRNIFMG